MSYFEKKQPPNKQLYTLPINPLQYYGTDFSLYKTAPFINMGASEESVFGVESHSYSLSSDDYLLDVSDYNNLRRACFDITVN